MWFTHINCSIGSIYFLCKSTLGCCTGKIDCLICSLFYKIRFIFSLYGCFPDKICCFYLCCTVCFFQTCNRTVYDFVLTNGIYRCFKISILHHLIIIIIFIITIKSEKVRVSGIIDAVLTDQIRHDLCFFIDIYIYIRFYSKRPE